MPKTSLTFIDQEEVKRDFKVHLDDESNRRILFSARFGAGKSTFLKHFFEDDEIAKSYVTLKLYPVNYSIAHNKDVFELVKYDIIYELLSKYPNKIDLEKDDYSNLLIGQMFLLHSFKIDPLIKSILKITNPESEVYSEITDKLSAIFEQYSAYKDKTVKDDSKMLMQYIKQLRHHKGSPHEYDDISELITTMLESIVKGEEKQDNTHEDITESEVEEHKDKSFPKTVLIIDDLDRLDPEHVFRLFNIFSAHYDSIYDENKFGFNKVIFVCDYNNIRLMYEHRYGKGVDFSGYIDKFYSNHVFHYDNRIYVRNKLKDIFNKKPQLIPEKLDNEYGPQRNNFYAVFEYLVNALLEINAITLRNLEQFDVYDFPQYSFSIGDSELIYQAAKQPFLILVHLLEKIINRSSLKLYLAVLSEKFESNRYFIKSPYYSSEQIEEVIIRFSLRFIVSPKLIFDRRKPENDEIEGRVKIDNLVINYSLGYNWDTETRSIRPLNYSNADGKIIENTNPFKILVEAITKIEDLPKHNEE
jgi:hypothetical protein